MQLRISKHQKEAIGAASMLRQTTLSQFVLENAYTAARKVLGEQGHFMLQPQQWKEFNEALDAPSKEIPALTRLLKDRGVLDQDPDDV